MLKFDSYKKEIETFINHMNKSLGDAWDEEENGNNEPIEKLYNSHINISFNGVTLGLRVAPCEFDAIIECLEYIKEESENY